VPQKSFPPYSFYPGGPHPHPSSDPRGHSFEKQKEAVSPLNSESWSSNVDYLYGFDLLNYGYYWEAHEVWESLWNASKKNEKQAFFLKGLIAIAAVGVKAREGNLTGVHWHITRASSLFSKAYETGQIGDRYMGISLSEFYDFCQALKRLQIKNGHPFSSQIVFSDILIPKC